MSQSPLAALLSTLHEAEQFVAGFEGDEAQQPPVANLLANLRGQILVTQAAIDSEAAHAATRHANASVGTAVPGEDPATAAARKAIRNLLQRIQRDPRLAWYFDSATRSMQELTEAHAALYGLDLAALREEYYASLTFRRPEGGVA